MTRSSSRCLFSAMCFACLPLAAYAQLPTAQLTTIFPAGGKVGTSVEVRIGGADLDDVNQLQFSHPGIKAIPKMSPATEFEKSKPIPGQFTVQIAGDVPPGRYDARVTGRFGVSNPRAFVTSDLPEANDPGGNVQPANALAIALDTTVNGVVDSNQVDHFKLPLKAGQRVIIECQAQRIDSRLDGTLVLVDSAGKELLRNRGYESRDPLLDFTAPADGEYRIQLYDFTYRGGSEYFYRLTAESTPRIDYIFPPSGLAGSNEQYTLYGRNLPGGQPAEGLTIAGAPLQKLSVNIPLPSDDESRRGLDAAGLVTSNSSLLDGITYRIGNSNRVRIHFAKGSVIRETEPNDQPAQAQTVVAPCEVVGQFTPSGDADSFNFAAKKGEVFNLEVYCHRLGLDADPFLLVQKVKKNEKGEEVIQDIAQVDDPGDRANRIGSEFDTSTDDPDYVLTADEDATYRVTVRDQFGASRNDPRFVYRLAIHRGDPDYRLIAYAAPLVAPANNNAVPLGGCVVRKGGSTMVEVRVDRRYGFNGEIEISAHGLPNGVTAPNILIGPAATTGSLIVTAAETAPGWSGSIRVVGRSTLRGNETIRYARSGVAVWNSGNRQQEYIPFRLTSELALSVMDREMLPALVQASEDKVWETSRGGKLEIPIKVTRRGDFKEDLTLAPNDIPNELKPQNLAIKGADAEGKLQFAATNGNAKVGVYTFYLRADAKLKHQRNPDAVVEAEQEQKAVDSAVAASTERNKQATEAKNAAVTLATNMATAAKQSEQAKTAVETEVKQAAEKVAQTDAALKVAKEAAAKDTNDQALAAAATAAEKAKADADAAKTAADQKLAAAQKALADALAAAKAAEDAKVNMEKAAAEADAKMKAVQQAKAAVDKRLTDAKTANNPKDLQFAVISTPIKVRIMETCLALTVTRPNALKAGEKFELPVKIDRLYGFDDQVEVTVDLASGLKGVTANKVSIAKGQAEGKIEFVAAKDATPGEHSVTVKAKGRFNNIENQTVQTLTLSISPP
jgi:hypothetical protein